MAVSSETLAIDPCPLCDGAHTYILEVERSTVLQYMNPDDAGSHDRTFVRFFVCPKKNNRFQADVSLTEDSGEKIRDVRVAGPSDRAK